MAYFLNFRATVAVSLLLTLAIIGGSNNGFFAGQHAMAQTVAQPSVTVQTAAELLAAVNNGREGDYIQLLPGTYTLASPLNPKKNMTIAGSGRDNTIIKGAGSWQPSTSMLPDSDEKAVFNPQGYLIFIGKNSHITIKDVTLTGENLHGAVYAFYTSDIVLENLKIENFLWSGVRLYNVSNVKAHNNVLINAGGVFKNGQRYERGGKTGGGFYFNHGSKLVFTNNRLIRDKNSTSNYYGFKSANSKYVTIKHNDIGTNFSIEFAHMHAGNVEISHNRITGTVSIPKHGGGNLPSDTKTTFDIHHNWFKSSYSLEWPRNGVKVHHNLFDVGIDDKNGHLITNFQSGTVVPGPALIYNNLINNPGRGIYGSPGNSPYNSFYFFNNHVRSAGGYSNNGNILGLFEIRDTADFKTISIENNIIEAAIDKPRPLLRSDAVRRGITIRNNRLVNITDTSSYANPKTDQPQGLLEPLKFFVGVDEQYMVDGWKLIENIAAAPEQNQPAAVEEEPAVGEAGRIAVDQPDRSTWHKVALQGAYKNPVVVATMSANGNEPAVVKLRNITGTSFEFQISEWEYLDGRHISEDIHYVVVESGIHQRDGYVIAAGIAENVNSQKVSVRFATRLSDVPVVFNQPQSAANGFNIAPRVTEITPAGLQMAIRGSEARKKIQSENIGWIAVAKTQTGKEGSSLALLGLTGINVTHNDFKIALPSAVSAEKNVFLADMQTLKGSDTADVRYKNLSNNSVTVFVEEETSHDKEIQHVKENIGYAIFRVGLLK